MADKDSDHAIQCLRTRGVKAIILIGSRALGRARAGSDYDFYLVVHAYYVPFLYLSIKKREKLLEDWLGSKVSASPLTLFRIRRSNDLLLYKTKMEGVTIWGNDYIPSIKINDIKDVPRDELFSYLFSSVYFLLEHYDPEPRKLDNPNTIILNTAKSILYCAEVQLMMKGIYETRREKMISSFLAEINPDNAIKDLVLKAADVAANKSGIIVDAGEFWFSAQNYVLQVFQELVKTYIAAKNVPIEEMIELYKDSKPNLSKNFQFLVQSIIFKRNYSTLTRATSRSIEKSLCTSLLYLLFSIENSASINLSYLEKAKLVLVELNIGNTIGNDCMTEEWRCIKSAIFEYWAFANGKSII